ncbi:MAG: hypothetical protein RL885_26165 [Planctomycetota bacterium]
MLPLTTLERSHARSPADPPRASSSADGTKIIFTSLATHFASEPVSALSAIRAIVAFESEASNLMAGDIEMYRRPRSQSLWTNTRR